MSALGVGSSGFGVGVGMKNGREGGSDRWIINVYTPEKLTYIIV